MIQHANKVFVIWASKRSGHHAIADWIRYQFDFPSLFFNDLPPGKPIQEYCGKYWINDKLVSNWEERYDETFQNVVMVNCESREITEDSVLAAEASVSNLVSNRESLKHILVLRDPFNNLASLLKIGRTDLAPTFSPLWKNHAETFLFSAGWSYINYNLWFTDEYYRWTRIQPLNAPKYLIRWPTVSQHGGGSSFDRLRLDGRASEMKVLERWKHYTDHPLFKAMLEDQELIELCRQIYPESFLDPILSGQFSGGESR